jgi:hypothetical protein
VEWCGLDSSGSGQGRVVGSCEHGNEPSGSMELVVTYSREVSRHSV